MLLKIKNLLTTEECARLVELSGELKFVDGRASNPANTSKQNLQADPADPKYLESAMRHLSDIDRFCSGTVCRHRALVEYFGQPYSQDNCRACDIWSPRLSPAEREAIRVVIAATDAFRGTAPGAQI